MKVQGIWESMSAVIYKIDGKCYFYTKEHNEMPYLSTGQEVSASVLGTPYKVITCRGVYPELAFSPEMKKVDCIVERVQAD